MTPLQLITSEQPEEKQKTLGEIRQELIKDFFGKYQEAFQRKYNYPFLKCIGKLKGTFEGVDEDSGEILVEYPSRKEWNDELKKFFANTPKNWYRQNGKCTFYLFCEYYGNFDHHIYESKVEPKKVIKNEEPPASPEAVKKYIGDWKKSIGRE